MTMPAAEKLVVTPPDGAPQEFVLSKASVSIGRATVNDIVIRDQKVSRLHVRVDRGPGGVELVDTGSANGVLLNDKPVARALLRQGDRVRIGDTTLDFVAAADDARTEVTLVDSIEELERTMINTPLVVHLDETALPRLAVNTPAKTWEVVMRGDALTIGRLAANDVVIDDPGVSRHHAVIERRSSSLVLRDLDSGNGTWMRGERIASARLDDGVTFQIGPARLVFKHGVSAETLSTVEMPLPALRPRVVVIPGFGGSILWRGSEKVWPAPARLFTDPEFLHVDEPLEARGLVDEVVIVPGLIRQEQYSSLTDYLEEELDYESGDDLLEFAYDFRQDNRTSARALAARLEQWDDGRPITLIAHSMGCLIARYYVECLGGRKRVGRVIYIGAPHSGTPYAFASLLHGPGLLPLGLLNATLRDMLASYPSWYQILPTYPFVSDQGRELDVLAEESWVLDEHRGHVRSARAFRNELGTSSSVPSVCVFGYGFKTITSATVVRETSGLCQKAAMTCTPRGDGMIPESSAILPASEIHPVQQRHGALYGNTDVKMRLKLELMRAT